MQRRAFLLSLAATVSAGLPALADSETDPTKHIVAELTQQGYSNIRLYTTWLGRVRILAIRGDGTREIVLNPRTGEILRDLWTAANGSQGTVSVLDDVNSPSSGTRKSSSGGSSGGGSGSDGSGGGSSDGGTSGGGSTGGVSGGGGGGTSGSGSSGSDSESDSGSNESSGDGSGDN